MKKVFLSAAVMLLVSNVWAQETTTTTETTTVVEESTADTVKQGSDGPTSIYFGSTGGLIVTKTKAAKKKVSFSYFNMDLGLNFMNDKTNYQSAEAIKFLNVGENYRNESLMSIRQGNSWNFNLMPITTRFHLLDASSQQIDLSVGVGIQVFNFKYSKPIHFSNDAYPMITYKDDVNYSKNKLSVMYASIPVMLSGNTKLNNKIWLHYGFGVIGGLNMSTWTKQKSDVSRKDKNHDMFNTDRFQVSLQAEVGLKNIFTLFGTYQLNSLFKDGIYQQPVSIGLRF